MEIYEGTERFPATRLEAKAAWVFYPAFAADALLVIFSAGARSWISLFVSLASIFPLTFIVFNHNLKDAFQPCAESPFDSKHTFVWWLNFGIHPVCIFFGLISIVQNSHLTQKYACARTGSCEPEFKDELAERLLQLALPVWYGLLVVCILLTCVAVALYIAVVYFAFRLAREKRSLENAREAAAREPSGPTTQIGKSAHGDVTSGGIARESTSETDMDVAASGDVPYPAVGADMFPPPTKLEDAHGGPGGRSGSGGGGSTRANSYILTGPDAHPPPQEKETDDVV
uniref:Uncharacterized protein n=1 Tax=Chromera velia CCMP2878 TaxID=1169474 RepID=A0A0G4GGL9_9ALVE|eukprot:Cvel_21751.t1-p1 / transcript=Cvel_21751.t1 / gene=Cvel_21751 / organism=Chromera_velia_CCMP2878 / gene_product=hypothetical protein / transcript_product=hypothetical protein / location=Cvel_scaffold2067:28834-29688(+) / protein_length=285 / sequence_SO=supercontig / SO=protein_coding / is_pseudo=false